MMTHEGSKHLALLWKRVFFVRLFALNSKFHFIHKVTSCVKIAQDCLTPRSPDSSVGTFAGKLNLCYRPFPEVDIPIRFVVLHLECANPWRHLAVMTNFFFTAVSNYSDFAVRNLLHVTFWRLEFRFFGKFVHPRFYSVFPNICRDGTSTWARPFPFTSFLIHYSLIIITFDAL
jgi:hypothetical protein